MITVFHGYPTDITTPKDPVRPLTGSFLWIADYFNKSSIKGESEVYRICDLSTDDETTGRFIMGRCSISGFLFYLFNPNILRQTIS